MWANHGDDISIQYSGTPALKGDFVRYFPISLYKKFHVPRIFRGSWNYVSIKAFLCWIYNSMKWFWTIIASLIWYADLLYLFSRTEIVIFFSMLVCCFQLELQKLAPGNMKKKEEVMWLCNSFICYGWINSVWQFDKISGYKVSNMLLLRIIWFEI